MAKSVARRLNFVYYSKISIKSNKPSSKPSKPTVSTYQAKQASFRCEKFQASKLKLSGLACLINSKSAPLDPPMRIACSIYYVDKAFVEALVERLVELYAEPYAGPHVAVRLGD